MISKEWKKTNLEDVLDLKNGKSRPKEEGLIPVYGGNGIMGYTNKSNITGETIIIGRVGAYCGATYFEDRPIWISDNALYAKARGEQCNKFFYYLLKYKNLNQFAGGSSHPLLTQGGLNQLELIIPDFISQKRIAEILSCIDDKIENNLQTNQTLEEIAKAIFNEWFVNFNYPNADKSRKTSEFGEIPARWEVGNLGDVLEIKYGKDHKHLKQGDIPVFGSGGIMRFVDTPLYEKESILIPRKGTLSNLFFVNKPFWSVDTMFYTIIKLQNGGKYLFQLLQTLNLAKMNVGTAVPSLTTEILNRIAILIPDSEILSKYEKIMNNLFIKIDDNLSENETLKNTRDSLLPKLMSGEIEVNG